MRSRGTRFVLATEALLSLMLCVACAAPAPAPQGGFTTAASKPVSTPTPPSTKEQEQAHNYAGLKFATAEIKEEAENPKINVEAKYPRIERSGIGNADKFNEQVKAAVLKQVAQFRKDVAEFRREGESDELGYSLEIDYEIKHSDLGVVSVLFRDLSVFSGAPHPNHGALTFNYDLKAGKELALADIFNPDVNYSPALLRYVRNALKKADDPAVAEHVGDDGAEELSRWNMTPEGLLFNIEVSHAEGSYAEAIVPYDAVENIIRRDGVLGRLKSGSEN